MYRVMTSICYTFTFTLQAESCAFHLAQNSTTRIITSYPLFQIYIYLRYFSSISQNRALLLHTFAAKVYCFTQQASTCRYHAFWLY